MFGIDPESPFSYPVPHRILRLEKKRMEITDNGRALVASPEFAASLVNFMKEWHGRNDEGAAHVCRIICLSLCEINLETGPALDSPELDSFVVENQREIEAAGQPAVAMLNAMRVVH